MRAIAGMNALNFCSGVSVFIIDCVIMRFQSAWHAGGGTGTVLKDTVVDEIFDKIIPVFFCRYRISQE
jgi:hypothetical protein